MDSDFKHPTLTMDNSNFNFSLINYSALFKNCIEIVNKYQSNKNLALEKICRLLNEKIDFYDWVGFYFLNEDKKNLFFYPLRENPPNTKKYQLVKEFVVRLQKPLKVLLLTMFQKKKTTFRVTLMSNQKLLFPFL